LPKKLSPKIKIQKVLDKKLFSILRDKVGTEITGLPKIKNHAQYSKFKASNPQVANQAGEKV
jgi:hypothetical protein